MHEIVLFDLGDVLADWDPRPRVAQYARRSGLSESEGLEPLSADDFWRNTDRGLYSGTEMHTQICARLGCDFTRDELWRLQGAAFRLRPDVLQIAREVAEFTRSFDPILMSFEFAHVKPERALFERVTARLAHEPGRICFGDDQAAHVGAARDVGWDAFRFESASRLRGELEKRGLCAPVGASP